MMRTWMVLIGVGALCLARAPVCCATELGGWIEADAVRLSAHELKLVERSLDSAETLRLEPSRDLKDDFAALFGGESGVDVVRYLRDRIRYLGKDMDEAAAADSDGAGTYASNYGPAWLDFIYKRKVLGESRAKPTEVAFRQRKLPIDSPRTGLVVLGKVFTQKGTSDFDRLETFVHEARHSDCPVEPSHRDLKSYSNEKYLEMSDAGRACTNLHMPCPSGHALAGELACDVHPWGAYMVGYVFAEEVFKRCRECSEAMRQQALVTAKEDLTRLAPELRARLRAGTLPEPVMESLP